MSVFAICSRLCFWPHLTSCLLPSLSQPCPSSRSSEVSETRQLHIECSSPSSLAAATAPQHDTDEVKHTHPPWNLTPLSVRCLCSPSITLLPYTKRQTWLYTNSNLVRNLTEFPKEIPNASASVPVYIQFSICDLFLCSVLTKSMLNLCVCFVEGGGVTIIISIIFPLLFLFYSVFFCYHPCTHPVVQWFWAVQSSQFPLSA